MITAYAWEVNRIVIKLSFFIEIARYLVLKQGISIYLFTTMAIS